jgi:hypothetical protein
LVKALVCASAALENFKLTNNDGHNLRSSRLNSPVSRRSRSLKSLRFLARLAVGLFVPTGTQSTTEIAVPARGVSLEEGLPAGNALQPEVPAREALLAFVMDVAV